MISLSEIIGCVAKTCFLFEFAVEVDELTDIVLPEAPAVVE